MSNLAKRWRCWGVVCVLLLPPLAGLLSVRSDPPDQGWQKRLVFPETLIMHIAFSPDGKVLTTLGLTADAKQLRKFSGIVKRWDGSNGRLISSMELGGEAFSGAFSANGKLLAVDMSTQKSERALVLWDLEGKKQLFTLGSASTGIHCVTFSPDSRVLAVALDKNVEIWDLATRKKRLSVRSEIGFINSMAFAQNSKTLAAGSTVFEEGGLTSSDPGAVEVWDLQSGKQEQILKGHSCEVLSVAFSPDGKRLASGSYSLPCGEHQGEVWLWDTSTWRVQNKLGIHVEPVRRLAFSPNGKLLATGGDDSMVILWDTAIGIPIQTLQSASGNRNDAGIHSMMFATDSNSLAICGGGGTVSIWSLVPKVKTSKKQ